MGQPAKRLQPTLSKNKDIILTNADAAGTVGMMRLNCLQPPFNDVRLRLAVRLAVQQDSYMRASQGDDQSQWADVEAFGRSTRHITLTPATW